MKLAFFLTYSKDYLLPYVLFPFPFVHKYTMFTLREQEINVNIQVGKEKIYHRIDINKASNYPIMLFHQITGKQTLYNHIG